MQHFFNCSKIANQKKYDEHVEIEVHGRVLKKIKLNDILFDDRKNKFIVNALIAYGMPLEVIDEGMTCAMKLVGGTMLSEDTNFLSQ